MSSYIKMRELSNPRLVIPSYRLSQAEHDTWILILSYQTAAYPTSPNPLSSFPPAFFLGGLYPLSTFAIPSIFTPPLRLIPHSSFHKPQVAYSVEQLILLSFSAYTYQAAYIPYAVCLLWPPSVMPYRAYISHPQNRFTVLSSLLFLFFPFPFFQRLILLEQLIFPCISSSLLPLHLTAGLFFPNAWQNLFCLAA